MDKEKKIQTAKELRDLLQTILKAVRDDQIDEETTARIINAVEEIMRSKRRPAPIRHVKTLPPGPKNPTVQRSGSAPDEDILGPVLNETTPRVTVVAHGKKIAISTPPPSKKAVGKIEDVPDRTIRRHNKIP